MSSVLCDFTKISLVRVLAVWNHLEIYLKDRYTLKTSIHAHLAVQANWFLTRSGQLGDPSLSKVDLRINGLSFPNLSLLSDKKQQAVTKEFWITLKLGLSFCRDTMASQRNSR